MAVIDALKKSQAQEGDTVMEKRQGASSDAEPKAGLLEQERNRVMSGGGGGTCQERESARMLADLGGSLAS